MGREPTPKSCFSDYTPHTLKKNPKITRLIFIVTVLQCVQMAGKLRKTPHPRRGNACVLSVD